MTPASPGPLSPASKRAKTSDAEKENLFQKISALVDLETQVAKAKLEFLNNINKKK